MNHSIRKYLIAFGILALCGAGLALTSGRHSAGLSQPSAYRITETSSDSPPGYHVTEENSTLPPTSGKTAGPVRLARFSNIQGNVDWRTRSNGSWEAADLNQPIREGTQVAVHGPGRAELQFDDGSLLRLGRGCNVTLSTLYSDNQGEFTQCRLTDGLATLVVPHTRAVYEVDTPIAAVRCSGPSTVRIGVDPGLEVTVDRGQAVLDDPHGHKVVAAGQYCYVKDPNAPYEVGGTPPPDSWDTWNRDREHYYGGHYASDRYLPPNVALTAGDLDDYGDWRDDPKYGHVWHPHYHRSDWRPYHDGHWEWIDPFGWTWVSDEPWGWAPYHYGTWIDEPYGWAWCPGPVNQYWCPAVVDFSYYNGAVAWAPLAPWEVRYPSFLSIGLSFPNWSLFFSIGQAGVFYPTVGGFCNAVPFDPFFVNRAPFVNNITFVRNTTIINNFGVAGVPFVPFNARRAAGASLASLRAFGGGGAFTPLPRGSTTAFARGRAPDPPRAGRQPVAGPRLPNKALAPLRTAAVQRMQRMARSVRQPALTARSVSRPSSVAGFNRGAAAVASRPAVRRQTGAAAANPARVAAMRARNALGMRTAMGAPRRASTTAPASANRAKIAAAQARTAQRRQVAAGAPYRTPVRTAQATTRRASAARQAIRTASAHNAANIRRTHGAGTRPVRVASQPSSTRSQMRFHKAPAAAARPRYGRTAPSSGARVFSRRQAPTTAPYRRPSYSGSAYTPRRMPPPTYQRSPGGYRAVNRPYGGYNGGRNSGWSAPRRTYTPYGAGGAAPGYRVREGGGGGFRPSGGRAQGGGRPTGGRGRRGNGG